MTRQDLIHCCAGLKSSMENKWSIKDTIEELEKKSDKELRTDLWSMRMVKRIKGI